MTGSSSLHVAIIGAGGLGGPVAYALARAGAALTICDDDVVELSNLQRQIQFCTADIGRAKVDALGDELERRGVDRGRLRLLRLRFTADSAADVIDNVDVIIDGSDSFVTKFEVNDQAMQAGIPFVIGSVVRYSGQVFAADPGRGQGCYRCLFEDPPAAGEDEGRTCADAGVLGAAAGVIGGLAARAALALARAHQGRATDQIGPIDRIHGLWLFDDVRALERARHVCFEPRRTCPACNLVGGLAGAATALSLSRKEAS